MTTKVGILQTGNPPPPLLERFGSYSAMVQDLLGPQQEFMTFDVRIGELPARADSCDAYVITGGLARSRNSCAMRAGRARWSASASVTR
jgi:hypothetical protein